MAITTNAIGFTQAAYRSESTHGSFSIFADLNNNGCFTVDFTDHTSRGSIHPHWKPLEVSTRFNETDCRELATYFTKLADELKRRAA